MIRLLNVYYPTRTFLLLLSETVIVSACFLAATVIILGSDTYLAMNYEHGAAKLGAMTLLVIICSYYSDLYEPQLLTTSREVYFRILLVLGFVAFVSSALLFVFPDFDVARNVYSLGLLLLSAALLLWRKTYDWIVKKEMFRERVCVLGSGEYAQSIVSLIQSRRDIGMEVVCSSNHLAGAEPETARQLLKRAASEKIPVHRIVVALEDRRGTLPVRDLLALRFQGVVVEEAGTLLERLTGKIQLNGLRPSSFLYAEGFRLKPSQQLTRRLVSFLAALLGLLSFAPFFPIVVLLVRFSSPGPVFYGQTRVGAGGRPFTVYKFRSMRQDAEAAGAKWASKNDPRVTKVGMFMRKTRIDEIPQLWNVLRGEMGFVGPRPERPEFVPWLSEQLPFYDLRHMIRPGLTGWAQVRYGYGATLEESREKLEYDLYYVKHMSLGLDLLIMFETIKTILHRKGAQ